MYKHQIFKHGVNGLLKRKGGFKSMKTKCCNHKKGSGDIDQYVSSLVKGVSLGKKQLNKIRGKSITNMGLRFIR